MEATYRPHAANIAIGVPAVYVILQQINSKDLVQKHTATDYSRCRFDGLSIVTTNDCLMVVSCCPPCLCSVAMPSLRLVTILFLSMQ